MMIDLDIVGINHSCQGIAIRDAVENAMIVLMPKREKPIYINVEIGLDEDMGTAAGYMVEGSDTDEFDIFLRQDTLYDIEELLLTVTHECIHIKQYLRRELRDINLPASLTCYKPRSDGSNHPHHIHQAHTPWQAKGSFYFTPIENEHGEYSHIHE